MTEIQRLEWEEVAGKELPELSAGKMLFWVADHLVGHAASLPTGAKAMTDQESLEDYAAGYDSGEPQEIEVTWQRWFDGELVRNGKWSFETH